MKRFLFLTIIVVIIGLTVAAQNTKKVAVWETKCSDNSITSFQSTMVRGGMETAVGNTPGYEVYDRSAFDAIMKEHNFQRSGAVDDKQIRQLGVMAGVQYIIVPEATVDGNEFYILVKMLDVETGKFGAVYEDLCGPSGAEIRKACSNLGVQLFGSSGNTGGSSTTRPSNSNTSTSRGASSLNFSVNGVNFEMIKVEAGSFTMGCTSEQGGDCYDWEKPSHRVTITQDYYIGKFEVTQELYKAVMGTNPSYWKEYNRPVENVSWNDAMEFCAELSRLTSRQFTLPTEAEWEYAARGGKKNECTKYAGGWSIGYVAWYSDNSGSSTHVCGTKRANALGIYDMSGNVWEWCLDRYGNYSSASQTDPMGSSSGSNRVYRGGGWGHDAENCRVSYRRGYTPDYRYRNLGFRVVLH